MVISRQLIKNYFLELTEKEIKMVLDALRDDYMLRVKVDAVRVNLIEGISDTLSL